MNADEAQKCLLVAQRLLAQANTADVEAANRPTTARDMIFFIAVFLRLKYPIEES